MSGKRAMHKRGRVTPGVSVGTLARAVLSMVLLYRKARRRKRALAGSKLAAGRGARCKRCGAPRHRGPCAFRSPVRALGAMSVGATALGAFAVGALAVGALAIKRLAVKRGEIERLDVRDLKVGRLEVDELLIREETRSQAQEPPPPAPAPPGGPGVPPAPPGGPGAPPQPPPPPPRQNP